MVKLGNVAFGTGGYLIPIRASFFISSYEGPENRFSKDGGSIGPLVRQLEVSASKTTVKFIIVQIFFGNADLFYQMQIAPAFFS